MPTTEETLFQHLPEQTKPEKSSFNLQMNAVNQWFNSLPMANISAASKAIYQALKDSNSQIASYKKRLYFLEKIHKPVTELTLNLKKLNLNRKLPLDKKHNSINKLIYGLNKQISLGYKYVLRDVMNCQIFFLCPGKQKTMTLALARIIRHHSFQLITYYQFYSSPDKTLWSDIQQLFLFADQENLLDKKVPDPSLIFIKDTSIKKMYLQILLVSIADPYRISQHHINSVFNQLEEWSSLADIYPHQDNDDKEALVIDLSGDSQPTLTTFQKVSDKNTIWTLNTSQLDNTHLLECIDDAHTQTTEINSELIKQLSLSWDILASRKHGRRAKKSNLKVAIGLNNVHFVLNGYNEPEWIQSQSESEPESQSPALKSESTLELSENISPDSSLELQSVDSTAKVSDIWGNIFYANPTPPAHDEKIKDIELPKYQPVSNTFQEWEIINESSEGYCLQWDKIDSIKAKVGDIIAISHNTENKDGNWLVGSIRWLKCIDKDKVQAGIQILASNATAVGITKFVSMQEGIKSRAILLPEIPILNLPKTLITTALGYISRDQVILDKYQLVNANITSVRTKVVLLDALESSSHFSRFTYALAEDFYNSSTKAVITETGDKEDTLSLDSDTKFDSIWDDD